MFLETVSLFLFLFFPYNLFIYIHITSQSKPLPPLLPVLPFQIPLHIIPPILLKDSEAPLGYHSTLGHLVPARLSISSPTEAQAGRGRGSNDRQQNQRQPLFQLSGDPHEDQAAHGGSGGTRSSLCMLYDWWFSLCEPP